MNCLKCGNPLVSQAELYRFEVKKIDRDPRWLTTIAPPTLRASIHLFILGFLVWISIIYPAFAFDLKRPLVRDYSIILAVTGLWFFIWRSRSCFWLGFNLFFFFSFTFTHFSTNPSTFTNWFIHHHLFFLYDLN